MEASTTLKDPNAFGEVSAGEVVLQDPIYKLSSTRFDKYLSMEIKTKEGGELEAKLMAYFDYDAAQRAPAWDFDDEPKEIFFLQIKNGHGILLTPVDGVDMTFVRMGVGSASVFAIGYYEELPAVGEARTARIL